LFVSGASSSCSLSKVTRLFVLLGNHLG
jgi:hypothetical protein